MSSGKLQLCVFKKSETCSSARCSCQASPDLCLSRFGCALEFWRFSLFGVPFCFCFSFFSKMLCPAHGSGESS